MTIVLGTGKIKAMKLKHLVGVAFVSVLFLGASSKKPAAAEKGPITADPSNCDAIKKQICTMEYRPFRCTARWDNGSPEPTPIDVRGGNPCEARNRLDHELCLKGIFGSKRTQLESSKKLTIQCTPQ